MKINSVFYRRGKKKEELEKKISKSQVPLKAEAFMFIAFFYHVSLTLENLQFSLG